MTPSEPGNQLLAQGKTYDSGYREGASDLLTVLEDLVADVARNEGRDELTRRAIDLTQAWGVIDRVHSALGTRARSRF